ncbi:MAG: uroporphyrinogen-III synthase [Pyrinomonadaceae bacterium]
MSKFSAEKIYALFDNAMNKKIVSELSMIGAKTILFPAAETTLTANEETEKILNNLNEFDWLIFTDIYAVEFFLQKMSELEIDLFELDALRACAYGESVADRLRFAQLHADVIPNSVKTAEVWQSLKNYLFDESEFENLKFLVLKKENSIIEIVAELKKQNSGVEELEIYQTIAEAENEIAKLKTLLKGGAIDEFIFTSPFDVINLAHLFPNENLADVLTEVSLRAADNAAAQSLREFRLI